MGYDLNFWKQQPGVKLDAQGTYERLSNGEEVEGVESLPIDEIAGRVEQAFATWSRLDPVTWDGPVGGFQLYMTPRLFRVDCFGMTGDDMNTFINIALEFGCPLYDPQTGVRFEP